MKVKKDRQGFKKYINVLNYIYFRKNVFSSIYYGEK